MVVAAVRIEGPWAHPDEDRSEELQDEAALHKPDLEVCCGCQDWPGPTAATKEVPEERLGAWFGRTPGQCLALAAKTQQQALRGHPQHHRTLDAALAGRPAYLLQRLPASPLLPNSTQMHPLRRVYVLSAAVDGSQVVRRGSQVVGRQRPSAVIASPQGRLKMRQHQVVTMLRVWGDYVRPLTPSVD